MPTDKGRNQATRPQDGNLPGHAADAPPHYEDGGALDDADYRAHAEFRYAMRRFMRYSEEQARALKLSPQQHLLLLTIRGHPAYPDVSISDVAERLQIRHHSASLLVDRAVKADLLTREKDSVDRRRVIVALTPKGERDLSQITQANRKELKAMEGALFYMRGSLRRALQTADDN